jgi:hypothetical protein
MTKLKVDTLKGLRLWLSVSDMETFALMANPEMSAEEISNLIQDMDSQDWLVLFKKFAISFHNSQKFSNLDFFSESELKRPIPLFAPSVENFATDPTLMKESEPDSIEVNYDKPNFDNLDELDFD